MKNFSYLINGVLAVAIIILFILFFKHTNKVEERNGMPILTGSGDSIGTLPVAYIDVDSLLSNYEFAKMAGERFMKKVNSSDNSIAQQQRELEKIAAEFQRKVQINAFLSQEKYDQERQRLQKMNEDLQGKVQRLQVELEREQQKINKEISDSVNICLDVYNRTANYELIFSNRGSMDNILKAKDKYNITKDVLNMLNARYKAGTK